MTRPSHSYASRVKQYLSYSLIPLACAPIKGHQAHGLTAGPPGPSVSIHPRRWVASPRVLTGKGGSADERVDSVERMYPGSS